MSHTTSIGTVVISDVGALNAAIRELKSEGINCELLENAVPRAYSVDQDGMGLAPIVVKLPDADYDVGLYADGKGGFEARTDFYRGSVERELGTKQFEAGEAEQAKLGKLFQRYAVCAAENHASMNGYVATRDQKADGTIQLVLNAA